MIGELLKNIKSKTDGPRPESINKVIMTKESFAIKLSWARQISNGGVSQIYVSKVNDHPPNGLSIGRDYYLPIWHLLHKRLCKDIFLNTTPAEQKWSPTSIIGL